MSRSFGQVFGLVALCILSGCKDGTDEAAKPQKSRSSKQHAGSEAPPAADGGVGHEPDEEPAEETGEGGSEAQPSASGHSGSAGKDAVAAGGSRAHAGNGAPQPGGAGGAAGQSHSVAGSGGAGGSAGEEPIAGQGGAGGAGGASGAGDGGRGGSGGSHSQPLCTGATPAASAFGAAPARIDGPSPGLGAPEARTNPGAAAPRYRLKDFQPLSCGYNATYGLEAFLGRPTLVALFASWCPYCQSQVPKLEELQLELEEAGKPVYIVVVNSSPANSPEGHDPIGEQFQFTERVTFPLLQDTDEVDAWALHGGFKDDLFIYRSDGTLQQYLPSWMGTVPIDLTTPEGYAAVKGLLEGTP
ncbi:MAG TPA: redoxin domain-containing protein [Polyangiales bacterium]|nr:redoxin domain-containing protein [Polyangiales bacterium]